MSVRTKMLGFVDVILRVPPIFIIDEILKISMGLPFATQNDSTLLDNSQIPLGETGTASSASSVPDITNGTNPSSNFNNSNSSIDQLLNATSDAFFGDAISSVTTDDTEFYKLISLTSLKFLSCLLGKYLLFEYELNEEK